MLLAAEEGLAWLDSLGIPHLASSRFAAYKEHLASAPSASNNRELQQDAIASLACLFVIQRSLHSAEHLPIAKLTEMCSGRPGHHLDKQTHPWNVQFELFVRGFLGFAGISSIQFGEPDLFVPVLEFNLGVAVKRVTSAKDSAIGRRVREGVHQLTRHGMNGIVFMEFAGASTKANNDSDHTRKLLQDLVRESAKYDQERRLDGIVALRFLFTGENGFKTQFHAHFGDIPIPRQESFLEKMKSLGRRAYSRFLEEHVQLTARAVHCE